VRDARAKAQKAGLSTFTQVVATAQGQRTRVRVGPFASREDAEKAAAQVKAAGLPGSVLAL
jgi:DedD protein